MSIGPLGPGGPGEWDDLFARFFGAAEPRRSAQRIDITRFMSADAREVLSSAARRSAETAPAGIGLADLDTEHLLWALLQLDPQKALVRRAGADPDALLAELGGTSRAPGSQLPDRIALTPAAKRALLDSLQLSRAVGASYVGPEHILMALGLNPTNVKLAAFGIGAMFAGFAGSFFAARQGFISPESFVFIESAVILAIVVLGGLGSQIGIVLSAVVLIGLPEFFRELEDYRMLAFGLVMVLIMIWRPGGLVAHREPTIRLGTAPARAAVPEAPSPAATAAPAR